MRRASWLARGLRQLGIEPRADSARQKESVGAPSESMEGKVAETLHTTVWMHWLHNHTQGRYKHAVNSLATPTAYEHRGSYSLNSRDGPRCGRRMYGGMGYGAAKALVQARPEFQMPPTIPWLPMQGNDTEEAVLEATRAVRAYIRWGRAFLRVRALVALCRPSLHP